MRQICVAAIVGAAAMTAGGWWNEEGDGVMAQTAEKELPIVCTLPEDALEARAGDLREGLFASVEVVERTKRGYAIRFPETQTDALVAFVKSERECCQFLEFGLRFEQGKGPVWLSIEGSESAQAFLDGMVKGIQGTRKE